jgi:hypothetical protein
MHAKILVADKVLDLLALLGDQECHYAQDSATGVLRAVRSNGEAPQFKPSLLR